MTLRLGLLGGGQLGRMLALSARNLGFEVIVLEPNPEAPARAAARQLQKAYDDNDALRELAACDFVTFEFENIPEAAAKALNQPGQFAPPVSALLVSQDRWVEKNTFQKLGIPTPAFLKVDSLEDAQDAFKRLGPLVLKTRKFGYDGKGQAVVRSAQNLSEAYMQLNGAPAIAEELVPFEREISVITCRGRDGQTVVYPVTENIHKKGVLHKSLAPAPGLSPVLVAEAQDMAQRLVDHFNYVGVLALELFQVDGTLKANEFAPRVHNSGHWTMEGAVTSQFENHVRAVCDLPLGCADLRAPSVMLNLIGEIPPRTQLLSITDAHLHDYAKPARPGRKVGHLTCLGATLKEASERAALAETAIKGENSVSTE